MPMYNLIEYRDNYSKTSGSVWPYCKDMPAVKNDAIIDFLITVLLVSSILKRK